MTIRAILLAGIILGGCSDGSGRFPVVVSVTSDDVVAFPDLLVNFNNTLGGKTGPDGRLRTHVIGKDGQKIAVSINLPKGYKTTTGTTGSSALVLRHLIDVADNNRTLPVEHAIKLVPLTRQYAVLVRTGMAGLPVEAFGAEQAITNSEGAAMFLYSGTPGDELQVKIATASHPELRPQNPSTSFVLGQKPDAYVVKEHFTVFKAPVKKVHKPTHVGPKKL